MTSPVAATTKLWKSFEPRGIPVLNEGRGFSFLGIYPAALVDAVETLEDA